MENLLQNLLKKKTGILINAIGIGKIIDIKDDEFLQKCVEFEVIRKEDQHTGTGKDRKKEEVLFKETMIFPINQIQSVSLGEKKMPKTETEKKLDTDLGDI